jgi:hypothetical protein
MTTEDQDAEVGRLVRERRDLLAHHEALIAKAAKMSDLLSSLGHALRAAPGITQMLDRITLRIDDDGAVTVSDQYHHQQLRTGQLPSAGDIRQILLDTTNVKARLSELEQHLKAFGI